MGGAPHRGRRAPGPAPAGQRLHSGKRLRKALHNHLSFFTYLIAGAMAQRAVGLFKKGASGFAPKWTDEKQGIAGERRQGLATRDAGNETTSHPRGPGRERDR